MIEYSKVKNPMMKVLSRLFQLISLLLIIGLVSLIGRQIWTLFSIDLLSGDVINSLDNILFTLILIELFTIIFWYIKQGYIKVERVIEVGIISLIREIIFKVELLEVQKLYAICALLVALGALFFIEKKFCTTRNKD